MKPNNSAKIKATKIKASTPSQLSRLKIFAPVVNVFPIFGLTESASSKIQVNVIRGKHRPPSIPASPHQNNGPVFIAAVSKRLRRGSHAAQTRFTFQNIENPVITPDSDVRNAVGW